MKKVNRTTKKIRKHLGGEGNKDIIEMFNQMLGANTTNIHIVYAKYLKIKTRCENLTKLFEVLANSPVMTKLMDLEKCRIEILHFCSSANVTMTDLFDSTYESPEKCSLDLLSEPEKSAFCEKYTKVKLSPLVNMFLVICDNLAPYRQNFSEISALNHKFITSMAGTSWAPFPFTSLDIKDIFCKDNIKENTMQFFTLILHNLYNEGISLYKIVSSPDIDVDEFSAVMLTLIEDVQKIPELGRCKRAFKKMKDSVDLLKTNLGGYYRDFITTRDSMIMLEHYIIDVSKTATSDLDTVRQFQTIIKYFKKISRSKISDPKLQAMFDKVTESIGQVEKGITNLQHIPPVDEPTPIDDSSTSGSEC